MTWALPRSIWAPSGGCIAPLSSAEHGKVTQANAIGTGGCRAAKVPRFGGERQSKGND
jgi:hypothetical protein